MARILLVEDNIELRNMLEMMLVEEKHFVSCASDGNQAIEAFNQGTWELVVMDLLLPNKEGLQTILEIRSVDPDLGILAISGGGCGSADSYLDVAKTFGANEALAKPFTRSEFLVAVEAVLGSSLDAQKFGTRKIDVANPAA